MAPSFVHLELVDFWSTVVRLRRPELADSRWALVSADSRILALSRSARSFGLRSGARVQDATKIVRTLRTVTIAPNLLQQELYTFQTLVAEAGGVQEFPEPGRAWIRFDNCSDVEVRTRVAKVLSTLQDTFSTAARAGIGPQRFLARQASSSVTKGISELSSHDFLASCGERPLGVVPGIPASARRDLWAFGLRTVSDLAKTDAASLHPYFGDAAHAWIARARGEGEATEAPLPMYDSIAETLPRVREEVHFTEAGQRRSTVRRRLERCARAMEAKLSELGRTAWEYKLRIVWSDGAETVVRSASSGSRADALPTTFLRMFRPYDLGGVLLRIEVIAGGLRHSNTVAAVGAPIDRRLPRTVSTVSPRPVARRVVQAAVAAGLPLFGGLTTRKERRAS